MAQSSSLGLFHRLDAFLTRLIVPLSINDLRILSGSNVLKAISDTKFRAISSYIVSKSSYLKAQES
ncbi:unnamed protein product [Penicillium roqueforti FM164]|uniref:Genomic scaffold, ProqFM164S03 n=1 Tax=Penicillium roqueforti (strain FM164) TaxID=1365484 RepID=W6QKU5_PENRF|nr:unnamed protein product [Penicillium roqueforti FM164]